MALALAVCTTAPATGRPLASHDPYANTDPPNGTDHGVDNVTFQLLWSGDTDEFEASETDANGSTRSAWTTLASGTDIPLDAPPAAIEQWNRGDLGDLPRTGRKKAVHPSGTRMSGSGFIRDAAITIFAVQPSTKAFVSASNQPHYIRRDGEVLAATDYRVRIPEARGSKKKGDRTYWRFRSARINETRLLVDGELESSGGGRTARLSFSDLDAPANRQLTMTVEAEIEAELMRYDERCVKWSFGSRCLKKETRKRLQESSITVRDSREVVLYDLSVSGFRARYPNGDLGLVLYKNQPWLGYTVPDGRVDGVWRFYSARDERWDSVTIHSGGGSKTRSSAAQPVQVYAYPITTGPTTVGSRIDLLDSYGTQIEPTSLPPNVHLDALTEPYEASFGLATRTETTTHALDSIRATGLVRGVSTSPTSAEIADIPIHESNLTLDVLDRSDGTVTVEVSLRDNETGAPIDTSTRGGYILLEGQRVNTSSDGRVRVTMPYAGGALSARYVPTEWWLNPVSYTGDDDVVYVGGTVLAFFEMLFQLGVPIGLFLLGVYLIDRITRWHVWPPWRGI